MTKKSSYPRLGTGPLGYTRKEAEAQRRLQDDFWEVMTATIWKDWMDDAD